MRPANGSGWQGPDPKDPPATPPHPVQLNLSISSPGAGATFTGPSNGVTVTVSGTAGIASGGGTLTGVDVQFPGGDFTPAQAGAPGFTQWSASQLITSSGGLTIVARARHSSGVTRTTSVDVTVNLNPAPAQDTTPPTVTIASPAAGSTMIAGADGRLAVTVAGTAGDVGGSRLAGVNLLVDGIPAVVTKLADDWSRWKADITLVGLGAHVITARAVDGAGLSMEAGASVQLLDTPLTPPIAERLLIVENYRLSSYLAAYGLGETVKTVSLLPGEKTTISVKTYKKTEESASAASSMLDSYTSESEQDFESTLTREQSNKETADESFKWNVNASGSVGWGFGSASLSAGVAGGSNASREEMAKNISNAVSKHAAKASAKRDVDIKSSREDKTETGDETQTDTAVENINLSRTLNFIFRQMNQEFITLLHLVDIRIGYVRIDAVDGTLYTLTVTGAPGDTFTIALGALTTPALPLHASASELATALSLLAPAATGAVSVDPIDTGVYSIRLEKPGVPLAVSVSAASATGDLYQEGTRASYQEVTLPQLDGLLSSIIVPERITEVRDGILSVLNNVFDVDDQPHAMVEEQVLTAPDGTPLPNGSYLRVPKGKTSTYSEPATGTEILVPGVILSVLQTTMRTDGIVCDAVLGEGQALDDYSQGLQQAAVEAKRIANDAAQVAVDRDRLALQLVQSGDSAAIDRFQRAFVPPKLESLALTPLPANGSAVAGGG